MLPTLNLNIGLLAYDKNHNFTLQDTLNDQLSAACYKMHPAQHQQSSSKAWQQCFTNGKKLPCFPQTVALLRKPTPYHGLTCKRQAILNHLFFCITDCTCSQYPEKKFFRVREKTIQCSVGIRVTHFAYIFSLVALPYLGPGGFYLLNDKIVHLLQQICSICWKVSNLCIHFLECYAQRLIHVVI